MNYTSVVTPQDALAAWQAAIIFAFSLPDDYFSSTGQLLPQAVEVGVNEFRIIEQHRNGVTALVPPEVRCHFPNDQQYAYWVVDMGDGTIIQLHVDTRGFHGGEFITNTFVSIEGEQSPFTQEPPSTFFDIDDSPPLDLDVWGDIL